VIRGANASGFVTLVSVTAATLAFFSMNAGARAARACKPTILTTSDVAAALHVRSATVSTVGVAPSAIPVAPGQGPYTGKTYACDWNLSNVTQMGFGEGRASVLVFATADDASSWFTAYTAAEKPSCKQVSFVVPACRQVVPVPSGVFPLFQAVQGDLVVWIHLRQRPFNLRTLEALATKVLARAAKLPPP
jgi:hypothetical protein